MKRHSVLLPVSVALTLAACATPPAQQVDVASDRAMLLVSRDDGSVVLQMIDSEADICFKQASSSTTTCFSQGDAIVDSAGSTVIGFEMHEEKINLVARSGP